MGQDVRQSIKLIGAELLGCEPGQIEIPDPDTDTSPFDTRTTSSRSTHMMGRALREAVADLERDGERGYGEVRNEGGLDPDTGQGIASTHWHQGAAAARVSVDEDTGRLTVEHVHAAVYAGRVVNRAGAELQNEGSMLMGLGTTLFEAVEFADGQVTNANFSDYNVPAFGDVPRLTHELIEREGAEVHGLGETALPPIPPAIGNALAHARRARDRAADHRRARAGGARAMTVDVILNGRAATLEARSDEMLLAGPAPARPAVGARDLRHRRLRRLHRAARRRAGVRLPDADGGRRRARDHDRRGARRGRSRPARVQRRARLPVRLVHARASC